MNYAKIKYKNCLAQRDCVCQAFQISFFKISFSVKKKPKQTLRLPGSPSSTAEALRRRARAAGVKLGLIFCSREEKGVETSLLSNFFTTSRYK